MNEVDGIPVREGGGNIFADLDLPDAEELSIKAELAAILRQLVRDSGYSQTKAAGLMGIGQADLSKLLRGSLRGWSVERLMSFLTVFNQDVEIVLRPHEAQGERGRISLISMTP